MTGEGTADFAPLLIDAEETLEGALVRLDQTGKGVLLQVDEAGRLLRTVTDGDLRRLLLAGAPLGAALGRPGTPGARTASRGITPEQALSELDRQLIDQLPVVDDDGRPVGLYLRRDLSSRIFLSLPHIGEEELRYVHEAFSTNWIAPLGPNVDAFERELADFLGGGHVAAVSSGTAAIHLALRLLGVEAGDTVLCSTLTFVASANPILYQHSTPVFVDSEPGTWNMSPAALERALESCRSAGRLPKAAIVVDLYGQSADFDAIAELCDRYGVPIVEDAAESLGATYRGRPSGTFGAIGIFSFNGNKIITTSGGGALYTADPAIAARARHLATQAREPAPHYEHTEVGYNYRMSNVLAGIGRGQLLKLEERVAARRAVFEAYCTLLSGCTELEWMPEPAEFRSNRWLTTCTLAPDIDRAAVIDQLARLDIEARPVWKPMHRQPLFAGTEFFAHGDNYDCAGDLFDRGLCLPSGSAMRPDEIERVANALRAALRHARRAPRIARAG